MAKLLTLKTDEFLFTSCDFVIIAFLRFFTPPKIGPKHLSLPGKLNIENVRNRKKIKIFRNLNRTVVLKVGVAKSGKIRVWILYQKMTCFYLFFTYFWPIFYKIMQNLIKSKLKRLVKSGINVFLLLFIKTTTIILRLIFLGASLIYRCF